MSRFYFFCGILAALFTLGSCGKTTETEPDESSVQTPHTVTFTCSFGQDTKVDISDAGKTRWEVGDKILVHGGNRVVVTLTASDIFDDGKKARISVEGITPYERPDRNYASCYYAAYPADAVVDGNLYYYARFNDTRKPLMAAYNDGDTMVFYNLSGLIAFRVSGDYDQCVFRGNNGETVGYSHFQSYLVLKDNGTPRLDWNYASDPGTSGPMTSVTVPVTADGETLNFIALPGGTSFSGGFKLSLMKNGNVVATARTTNSVTVARGNMIGLGDITAYLHDVSANLCMEEYLGQRPVVIAYLTEYTSAASLDATYVTHINYAHGRFKNPSTGDGGIVIAEPDLLEQVLALKTAKPSLKVLLMIGGWGAKADGFSMMARDADKRTEFCLSCKTLIDTYGLDGIDIDWEYPTYPAEGNGAIDDDTDNFNLVLQELRATIGNTKIISVASADSAKYIDWETAIQYVDYVNAMTYSMGDPPKYHNSTLYHSTLTRSRSCEESIEAHVAKGIPLSRLVLGVPFYGHGISPYSSSVKFRDIAAILAATTGDYAGKNIRHWDDVAKVPYLTDSEGNMYVGYDDEESVTYKGQFARDNGLLGAMFWEYRHDDDAGTLRQALYNALYPAE